VIPSSLTFTASQEGGIMFSVMLVGMDLSVAPRLFDFTLWAYAYTTGYVLANKTQIPLVQCTEQHFGFN
jgi:hypothetical protein